MKIPKNVIKFFSVFIVLGLVGYVVYIRVLPVFQEQDAESPEVTREAAKAEASQKIPVQAVEAFRGDLIIRVSALGTVTALHDIPIRSLVDGRLNDLPVFEGKQVGKGDLIAAVDDREYRLVYDENRANVQNTRQKYIIDFGGRKTQDLLAEDGLVNKTDEFIEIANENWRDAENLLKSGQITESEYNSRKKSFELAQTLTDENRAEAVASTVGLTQAETQFERAKMDLENTRMTAPISGVIGKLDIQEGHYVSANSDICRIYDVSKVRIEVQVLEPEVGFLKKGRKAKVTMSAFPGETFEGIIETISPIIENTTCTVTVLVDNKDRRIKPGMFAFVELDAEIFENRLLVPKESVIQRQNRDLLFVVREDKTVWNYVTIGLSNEEFIEILDSREGLEPGEQVITSGHFTLGHDVPVRIVKSR